MTWLIASLTFRQLLGQRRILVLLAVAAIPLVVAIIFRLGDRPELAVEFTEVALFATLVTTGVLPVIAVVIATSALGNEFEDRTALFLLAKPVRRGEIVAGKWIAAALSIALLVVPSSVVAALISLGLTDAEQVVPGFALALLLASAVYAAVLLALSVVTSRALVVGLVYVFLWEGAITELFRGARIFSVRQFTLGLADALTTVPRSEFEANLAGGPALIGLITAGVLGIAVATWRLSRWETRESA